MIGTQLSSYEILEEIGRGGMATVYRAYQPSVDRFVAIKVIAAPIAEDPEALRRFQREARVIARLEHPHLLPIYDFDGAHDPPYIVMRYLQGGTLKEVLHRDGLSLGEAGYLLRQVAAALDYAHRRGVVHCDVKPSNIMIGGEGNAYVSDFGIARAIAQTVPGTSPGSTEGVQMAGTPAYMAPEQVTGQGVDRRADLYALGVVLFEILTGRLPYQGATLMEVLMQHLSEPVPSARTWKPGLPAEVDEVLRRAMAKEPGARYGTASELVEAAVAALKEEVPPTPARLRAAVRASIERVTVERDRTRDQTEATLARYGAEERAAREVEPRRTLTEQNRLVTALHADLGEIADRIATGDPPGIHDPQGMHDVLETLWRRLEEVIVAHGGRVQSRTDDAALALWGVEVAQEDDPERAIRAALEIQDLLRKLLDGGDRAQPLPVRVGITTGLALLTSGEAMEGRVTASGEAIDTVHDLGQIALSGNILISHDTYRHVRGVFDVEAGDPLPIRGRRRPLETYAVRSAKPRAFRLGTRGVEGVETRMVGRRGELERLQEAFYTAAEDSETQMVTVVSEPGLGKSRLLYEFRNWLELEGGAFWLARGRATPEMAQRPYALLRDLFSFRFEIQDSDSPAEVRAKLEQGVTRWTDLRDAGQGIEMAHFIGHLIGYDHSDSPYLAGVLADAHGFHRQAQHHLMQFFVRMCRRTPVVIELSDIQWADDPSLDAINHLVRWNSELSLLVVCLARPELYERRATWGSGQLFHTRLELRPLSRRESRRLVEEILQKTAEVPDALRDLIVERAEGNPFYIEELIKVLIEDRVILREEPAWRVELERLSEMRVPSTLTGLVQARLDGLFPAESAVLQRAAVVGRIFWDSAVRSLEAGEAYPIDTSATLQSLADRRFVHARAESMFAGTREYIFGSNILRDVVLGGVLRQQRQAYHAQVGRWLIQRGGERVDENAGLIADHLAQAGQTQQAVPYVLRAGEVAQRGYANGAAIGYYQRALPLLPPGERVPVLLKLGKVLELTAQWQPAREQYWQALALSAELGDREGQAWSETAMGELFRKQGQYAEASAGLRRAQARFEELHNDAGVGQVLHYAGTLADQQGDYETARDLYQRSLAIRRRLDDRRAIGSLLSNLGIVARRQGDLESAHALYAESLSVRRALNDRWAIAVTLNNVGNLALDQGRTAEARSCLEEAVSLQREVGDRWMTGNALNNLGNVARAQGDYEGALALYGESLAIYRDLEDKWALAYLFEDVAWMAALRGAGRCALRLVGAAAVLREQIGAPLTPTETKKLDSALEPARASLSEADQAEALAEGREMTLEGAMDCAIGDAAHH